MQIFNFCYLRQAIMPVYGLICLYWFLSGDDFQPMSLLFPSLFLPYWCYLSYRSIFKEFSYKTILIGGVLAEISHIIVFIVALTEIDKTMHLLMCITSVLFFVETIAFLAVVTIFHPTAQQQSSSPSNDANNTFNGTNEPLHSYHNQTISNIL